MEQKVTPGFFYGSALATLIGLVLGLALHGPWESHPGGPQIWFSSAAAEELKRPVAAEDQARIPDPTQDVQQVADTATSYVPQEPLPVTRLDPDRFDPKPADADPAEREDVDEIAD